MTKIMTKPQRFLKSRQLHTIISQETIKPSSPTPPHLKTHRLAVIDQLNAPANVPFIFFYKTYNHGDIKILKNSLSQTLASYYPFAGRLVSHPEPQIDCNDQGVEFFEAVNDSRLNDFVFNLDETLDQLIPNYKLAENPNLVDVQVSHFTCGGAAVTVSLSHKVGDGFTVGNFINHWATVTRGGSPINPIFLSSKNKIKLPEFDVSRYKGKFVSRRFVFANSKLNELKNKVNTTLVNYTRVEILSSLLFKCAVDAATTLSGSFKPSKLFAPINMRRKTEELLSHEIAAGNILIIAVPKVINCYENNLNEVLAKLRKEIRDTKDVKTVEELGEQFLNKLATTGVDESRTYIASSLCRFPFYNVDFGWGKPVQCVFRNAVLECDVIHLMDTPFGDGVEAIVNMPEDEMDIFEKDKEILAYSQDI